MENKITWRCPSNIALVKYWGKRNDQIPCNPSVSLTLQNSFTDVSLILGEKKKEDIELDYLFHGQPHEHFRLRILNYLERHSDKFDILRSHAIIIESVNSFPHSAGIASSASAFGAIALALLSVSSHPPENFYRQASYLARLGSGSACRSMFAPYALWGHVSRESNSSDEYAVPVTEIHSNFCEMNDAILIVDDSPKKVSSSKGHALMEGHRYAEVRFKQAHSHCNDLLDALNSGDQDQFISIIEKEALALHAMMMTSEEYFMLMKPGTLNAIEKIMNFRKETGIPVTFTLDAGPNVHMLYPGNAEESVRSFLDSELKGETKKIIYDRAGSGPEKISG